MGKETICETQWIRETRFGRWFLSTGTWVRYVLLVAIKDFSNLIVKPKQKVGVTTLLDAGCGAGLAFEPLEAQFKPRKIIAIDFDEELFNKACIKAKNCMCEVEVKHENVSDLSVESGSIDMIFCHQLLHHMSDQEGALSEFMRVLVPGGLLLVGESCHAFIKSLPVRLFFKHPKHSQKNAAGYVKLVQDIGFIVDEQSIQVTTPWWSRPDLGLLGNSLNVRKPLEPTEVLIVAVKP